MSSSISSAESSIISGVEFEQGGGGEQQEKKQISNLKKEVQELKNVVNVKDSELQEVKKQLDELKTGQIAQSNRLLQLERIDRTRRFSKKLPPPNSEGEIVLPNGHKYTPDIEPFIQNGAPYCHGLSIQRGPDAFAGYPPNFFDQLIMHPHETENPDEMVRNLNIELALNNPAPWPPKLAQLHIAEFGDLIRKEDLEKDGVPTLKEEKVDYGDKMVEYTMGNKHKPEARFKLRIHFEGGAKCYQQMTRFTAKRMDVDDGIITFSVPGTGSEFVQGEKKETERISKLEKEVGTLKDQLGTKNLELQQVHAKIEKLEKENDQLNEIKNRQSDQITSEYARTLPALDSDGDILLKNGHRYTPEMGIFLRFGAAYCDGFFILRGISDDFVGYPPDFLDDMIQHCYETKVPTKVVRLLNIELSLENPAPWPATLVQLRAGEMNVEGWKVDNDRKCVVYILRNKHNPRIAFALRIHFEGDAKCFQQMTSFIMWRVKDVQSGEV